MDKSTLPRWGWLLLGLIVASLTANIVYQVALRPIGLPEAYSVVVVIAAMSLVLIYIGIWYDEDKQGYWEYSKTRILGDVAFVLVGASLGSAVVLTGVIGFGFHQFLQDVISMIAGFLAGWGLFWWRNSDLYDAGASLT